MTQLQTAAEVISINEDLRARYLPDLQALGFDKNFLEHVDGPTAFFISGTICAAVEARVYESVVNVKKHSIIEASDYLEVIAALSDAEKKTLRDKILSGPVSWTEEMLREAQRSSC